MVTARFIGKWTDQVGKVTMFRRTAVVTAVAMLVITQTAALPLWGILMGTTVFFICMNGRMIPGMAIITSSCKPELRGTFMALNSAVQSAAMGVAAFVGGLIVSRDAQGLIQNYGGNAALGIFASIVGIWLVGKLTLFGAASK